MSKYLGDVSAYAYAVSQGYTGTEEEFAELMASYATVAQNAAASASAAAQSATAAAGSASSASGSAETATTKASEAASSASTASGAASTATTKASEAATSATNAGNSATAAAGSATDANTAKTAAQTAKTGAETAQTAAAGSATAAAGSASTANTEALKSEGYAVGKQNGTDVASGSPYYQNNAKYYAAQAQASAAEAASIISNAFTYRKIVEMLRMGQGDLVPNGTTFTVPHAVYGNIEFVTRGMNLHKVKNNPTKPTITIQPKYLLSVNGGTSAATFQYDRQEAFVKVKTAIPANTVCKFTTIAYGSWAAGTYNFTPTADIPVGSMLGISGYQNTALTSLKVNVYAGPKATTTAAQYDISSGAGGATVDLGTWGTDANHPQRVSYGSNNEEQSGIFQFLNGDSGDGYMADIWEQKTEYDMMPTAFTSLKGFLGGFPADFLACLGLCEIPNLTNNVYEESPFTTGEHYTHEGYFFLPSRKEIYGTAENTYESDETQFLYYAEIGTTDAGKLMYAKGASAATTYWLRTPVASGAHYVRVCRAGNGGALDYGGASFSYGAAPLAILA